MHAIIWYVYIIIIITRKWLYAVYAVCLHISLVSQLFFYTSPLWLVALTFWCIH